MAVSESRNLVVIVLPNAPKQIRGNADIERSVALAGQDVIVSAFLACQRATPVYSSVIPAKAGMTGIADRMTVQTLLEVVMCPHGLSSKNP